ncbi:response regulator [Halioxenophilus aromaticivorans]|uniref:Response regulator n=1 Tax=Halioxenophilus aromaticivorans TaxID=1306992 RepID=A0AAV3U885_9ALTE
MTNELQRRLLIAEDDPDDQLLISDALQEAGIPARNVQFFDDGRALLDYLEQRIDFNGVVLMDLNMPRMDGREALKTLKRSPRLRHIPVMVLTTSSSDADVHLTYATGGNTFFTKPTHFDELVKIMSLVKRYWVEQARLAKPPEM